MKRLEEILEMSWSKNTNNEPLDEKYIGETTAIHEAMKLYAREVAQASLEKAAENLVQAPFSFNSDFNSQKIAIKNPKNITLL